MTTRLVSVSQAGKENTRRKRKKRKKEREGKGRRDNKSDRIAGKLGKLSGSEMFELPLDRGSSRGRWEERGREKRKREEEFLHTLSLSDDSVGRIEINTVIFGQRKGSHFCLASCG